ncbi:MAG TPA: hypothetical protein VFU94_14910 [Conexibacter sp.]|nr:hypothetical protein [Conexibacter sp.]
MPQPSDKGTPDLSTFERGVCVFCGFRGKLSNEHVWPDWLAQFVIDDARAPWVKIGRRGGVERIWDAPMFHHKVRRVCRPCNNGWLSDIENAVKPFLRWMILGRDCQLDSGTQATFATWCTLRAFMAQFAVGESSVPPHHFRWIYDHREPPTSVGVWLAIYGGRRFPVFAAHNSLTIAPDISRPDHEPTGQNAYFATFSVGRLAFQVFGHYLANARLDLRRPPTHAGFVQQIRPSAATVRWPPPRALTDEGLHQIAQFALQPWRGP